MTTAIRHLALAVAVTCCLRATADAPTIAKNIGKQPGYRKAPAYGLLVFGPGTRHRVWMVRDGDVLYVDRNGNGDLTDPGEKVLAEDKPGPQPEEERPYSFNAGDVTVGGRTHKGLRVRFLPLTWLAQHPQVTAALKKNPKALAVAIEVQVELPGMKRGMADRPTFVAGPMDSNGILQFADTPARAPLVHAGGPLQITFFGERPTLRAGRDTELTLVVGSPGTGPGTFAMLAYEGTIPDSANPVAEIRYQSAKPGHSPLRKQFEIRHRC